MLAATGTKGSGDLYLWDKQWSRILVYDKVEGTYLEQYVAAAGAPAFADLRGMYIVDRGVTQPPVLVWARPEGLYQVPLTQPQTPTGSPGPSTLPSALPSALPSGVPSGIPSLGPSPVATRTPPPATATPIPPSTVPTERPRRTPSGVTPSATP